ncbi:MAG: hypothetical protein WAM25_14570, partial [Candidatus Acidiferrales bacterium]
MIEAAVFADDYDDVFDRRRCGGGSAGFLGWSRSWSGVELRRAERELEHCKGREPDAQTMK